MFVSNLEWRAVGNTPSDNGAEEPGATAVPCEHVHHTRGSASRCGATRTRALFKNSFEATGGQPPAYFMMYVARPKDPSA